MSSNRKKTNNAPIALIGDLKAQSRSTGAALWRDVAKTETSRSNWAEPNLSRLSRTAEKTRQYSSQASFWVVVTSSAPERRRIQCKRWCPLQDRSRRRTSNVDPRSDERQSKWKGVRILG